MRKKAFTLIELLVTIILFSLLLATALYSFRFISINMRMINNTNPVKAMNYELLRRALNGVYFYVDSVKQSNDLSLKYYHFFKANPQLATFITKRAFFSKELSIVTLEYKNGKLWYKEAELFPKNQNLNLLEEPIFSYEYLLAENIKKLSFSYSYKKKSDTQEIPTLMRIKIEDNRGVSIYYFQIKSDNYENIIWHQKEEEVL